MGMKLFKKIKYCVVLIVAVVMVSSSLANGYVNSYASDMATPVDATATEQEKLADDITTEITEDVIATEAFEATTGISTEEITKATTEGSNTTDELVDSGSLVREVAPGEPSITYSVHCQTYGWMTPVSNGERAGTSGQSKRLEAICIELNSNGAVDHEGNPLTGGIKYRTHVQTFGWQDWVTSEMDGESVSLKIDAGDYAGTSGLARRLEGIEIQLTGEIAEYYDVIYRTHVQTYGWLDPVRNGAMSGTTGQSKRLETIEIALVKKNQQVSATLSYRVHSQSFGWMNEISPAEGEYNTNTIAGSVGLGKRLEAIEIDLETTGVPGGVEYTTHVQSYGWMPTVSDGELSGTTGQSKRVEAISINLTGTISAYYDIYYRVHIQNLGWLDWARNGQRAGTQGVSLRLEAIQIMLVKKGSPAPGLTTRPFYNCTNENWGILPGALQIKVNKQMNCITIYKGNVAIKAIVCSTGYATPVGTFDLKSKWRWKELIHDVYGQYSCHITGQILFHSVPYDDPNIYKLLTSEYNKLGQTASAGCIRLTTADAKWIYDNCPTGTKVVIYNSEDPGPLGKPTAQKLPYGQTWDPTDPLIN